MEVATSSAEGATRHLYLAGVRCTIEFRGRANGKRAICTDDYFGLLFSGTEVYSDRPAVSGVTQQMFQKAERAL